MCVPIVSVSRSSSWAQKQHKTSVFCAQTQLQLLHCTCSTHPRLPEVAELRLGPTLLFAHCTVAGEGHISAHPAVLHGSVAAGGGHDLLAGEAPVGPAQALLVGAHAAAVAESPLEDVLGAHAAVGGLVEQVRVVPAVLALAEEILHVSFPLGALGAAPQRDDDRNDDGQRCPEQQRPLLPGAAVVLSLFPLLVHLCWGVMLMSGNESGAELRQQQQGAESGHTPRFPRDAHVHGQQRHSDSNMSSNLNICSSNQL